MLVERLSSSNISTPSNSRTLSIRSSVGDRAALLGYYVGYILGSPTSADAIVRVQGINKDKVLSETEIRIIVKAIQDYIETY